MRRACLREGRLKLRLGALARIAALLSFGNRPMHLCMNARGGTGAAGRQLQLPIQPFRLCFRLDAQVALEGVAAKLELPECVRTVATGLVVTHQGAVRFLVRGVKMQQPLRRDGCLLA